VSLDTTEKLEWALFGAYLLDCGGIRDRVTSADFEGEEIAGCVQEIEQHARGDLNIADVRKVPALLEKLGCSIGGKAIESIMETVKKNRREKQISAVCKRIQYATNEEDRESLFDRLLQLRGNK
jgi:hypothetical protein